MYEWLTTPKYYDNAYDATITAIAVLQNGMQGATFIETHSNDEVFLSTASVPGTRYGHEIATCSIQEEDEDDDDGVTTEEGDYLYIYETSKKHTAKNNNKTKKNF